MTLRPGAPRREARRIGPLGRRERNVAGPHSQNSIPSRSTNAILLGGLRSGLPRRKSESALYLSLGSGLGSAWAYSTSTSRSCSLDRPISHLPLPCTAAGALHLFHALE